MKFLKALGLSAALLALIPSALAQFTNQGKTTVAITNTFVKALNQNSNRSGCNLQYRGSTTGYVFFGASAPSDTTTSYSVSPGQTTNCSLGFGVLHDSVWVTGTAGDVFVKSEQ